MTDTPFSPPPQIDYNAAKRQFVELYGSLAVMNTYLKIALLCVCAANFGLVILTLETYHFFAHARRPIVRINELGRAGADFGSLDYHPQEAEIRYFLIQFVQQHYG